MNLQNAKVYTDGSHFIAIPQGAYVVAQRKAEVNGKKYYRKHSNDKFKRNIFMLFR